MNTHFTSLTFSELLGLRDSGHFVCPVPLGSLVWTVCNSQARGQNDNRERKYSIDILVRTVIYPQV